MFWCWKGWSRACPSGGGTGMVSSGAGSVLPWAPPIKPSPLPDTTLLFHQMQALWARRTQKDAAGARFFDVTDALTLLLKGKTQCPCLQTRSRNQPHSAQRRREEHRAFRVLGTERNLSCTLWLLPTHSCPGREILCFAAGRTEA